MRVSKWGNSLAVRLPAALVEALDLKEGDEVLLQPGKADGTLRVERDTSEQEALELLRALRKPLPPGWKFDRDEANER